MVLKNVPLLTEDLNYYLEKRSVKEKIRYYSLKDFDKKLNKRTLSNLFKKIGCEILNKKRKIKSDIYLAKLLRANNQSKY